MKHRTWIPPLELSPDPTPMATMVHAAPVCIPLTPKINKSITVPQEDSLSFSEPIDFDLTPRAGQLWRWFVWSAGVVFTGIAIEGLVGFLLGQYRLHPVMGIFFAVWLTLLTGVLVIAIGREMFHLKAIRHRDRLRDQANRLMVEDSFGQALPLLVQVTALCQERLEQTEALQKFRGMTRDHLEDKELVLLFSDVAMRPLDEAVLRIIGRHAASAALFAVISPFAFLDALLFFWRNIKMTREIASIYGLRPGLAGSWLLMRNVAEGMLAAGIGELLTHTAADTLGDALAGAALAGVGQAATNALFTARLGLNTMMQCRPVPFPEGQKPGLGRIRQELKTALASPKPRS